MLGGVLNMALYSQNVNNKYVNLITIVMRLSCLVLLVLYFVLDGNIVKQAICRRAKYHSSSKQSQGSGKKLLL